MSHKSPTPAGALSTCGDEVAHRWNMFSEAGALSTCRDEVACWWNMFSDILMLHILLPDIQFVRNI